MTIYAVGDEHDSYATHIAPRYGTSAKSAESDYNITTSSTGYALLPLNASVDECWVHFSFITSSLTATVNLEFFGLKNGSTGKSALRLVRNGSNGDIVFQYNHSGVLYTTIATVPTLNVASLQTVDFKFKRGASGELKVLINKMLKVDTTGNYTTVDSTWDCVNLAGIRAAADTTQFGDVIVSSVPCLECFTSTLKPASAGHHADWSGAYTNLLSASGLVDKTTGLLSNTVGESFTHNIENTTPLAAFRVIKSLAISTSALADSAATPADVEVLVRLSGTDYLVGALGLDHTKGIQRKQVVLDLDPTSAPWTESTLNAIEVGLESV